MRKLLPAAIVALLAFVVTDCGGRNTPTEPAYAVATPTPTPTQLPTAYIFLSGTVLLVERDGSTRPAVGATVSWQGPVVSFSGSTTTDSTGAYSFNGAGYSVYDPRLGGYPCLNPYTVSASAAPPDSTRYLPFQESLAGCPGKLVFNIRLTALY